MAASSERRGRKIKREGGLRSPACKACQQRKVKCSGGSPCSACCRKAAWDGVPPPEHCEYDGGFIPARKTPPASTARELRDPAECDDSKGKGKSGKPLQKGLACLACKARRVRCDGTKPACSSCKRTAKRERREPCCIYRADLHVAQQQIEHRRALYAACDATSTADQDIPSPPNEHEEPRTSPRSRESSGSPQPVMPPIDLMIIPESALPPLPDLCSIPSPLPSPRLKSMFAPVPPAHLRSASSASISTSASSGSMLSRSCYGSHPPSPSLTHTSTEPSSSSYPSPATPFSAGEDLLPPNLDNYPPLPYPPTNEAEPSLWAVPPLALGAAVSADVPSLPLTSDNVGFHPKSGYDFDLTFTLPMSPPRPASAAFSTVGASLTTLAPDIFLGSPVKSEPNTEKEWWIDQVRNEMLHS
ncbi:Zn(II)2Cys6 transcription factor domain-containing protein [Sporobolomyces koalae]|uniref:Zn(II)2Cys6 transcription factor domain-containing protein n=1 Tax=Sporobolomyces koalae TaxID=500713 RepID=UPI0031814B6E